MPTPEEIEFPKTPAETRNVAEVMGEAREGSRSINRKRQVVGLTVIGQIPLSRTGFLLRLDTWCTNTGLRELRYRGRLPMQRGSHLAFQPPSEASGRVPWLDCMATISNPFLCPLSATHTLLQPLSDLVSVSLYLERHLSFKGAFVSNAHPSLPNSPARPRAPCFPPQSPNKSSPPPP
jgi:hypothetical protein